MSREDPDGCLVIPLDCIAEAIDHHISEGVEFPDGYSDMDSLPDGQCLDPGLEAGDMLHDLHAVIARQALLPLVILGGDVNGGQECLHQHVAMAPLMYVTILSTMPSMMWREGTANTSMTKVLSGNLNRQVFTRLNNSKD